MKNIKLIFLIVLMEKYGFKKIRIASLPRTYQYLDLHRHNIFRFSFHKINC
jgi:hypothetical protein